MFDFGDGEQVPGPGGPALLPPGLQPFAATVEVVRQLGAQGRTTLAGATPEQVMAFLTLADEMSRIGYFLRGEAIHQLASVWTFQDPGHPDAPDNVADSRDPGRAARLRTLARATSRAVSRVFPGCDEKELTDRAQLAEEFAIAEASLGCVVSRYAARTWLRHACALTPHRLPLTREAYAAGRIEVGKVAALVRLTESLTDQHCRQVDAMVLPYTVGLPDPVTGEIQVRYYTVRDVEAAVIAAILALDPDHLTDRAEEAAAGRTVTRGQVDPLMGRLQAILPVADIALIWQVLTDAAEAAEAAGDPRTEAQVRADTLRDLILHGGISGLPGPDATTLLDTGPEPETEPDTEPEVAPSAEPVSPAAPPTCRCGKVPTRSRVDVVVVIGLETLLGLNSRPATLRGYGPISAHLARDLAAHGTWRCAATDDVHHTLLGLGTSTYTPRYTPPQQLRRMAQTAWPTCAFPNCTLRSIACDLDHTKAWPSGATCDCNLRPLCRTHHRLKTTGLLQVAPSHNPDHPPGTLLWTTRTGRRHVAVPPGLLPIPPPDTLTAATRHQQRRPPDDDPPPF